MCLEEIPTISNKTQKPNKSQKINGNMVILGGKVKNKITNVFYSINGNDLIIIFIISIT
jgi:hypothetical protein